MKRLFLLVLATLALAFFTDISHVLAQQVKKKYRGADLILETGGFKGIDEFQTNGFSPLAVVGGYTFNEHLFLGAGTSLILYKDYDLISIPLFIRIKSALLKSRITPYLQLDGGCNIPVTYPPTCIIPAGEPGFLFLRPEIGVLWRLHNRQAVHFGIGCMINNGEYSKYMYTDRCCDLIYITADRTFAVTFTAGFTF